MTIFKKLKKFVGQYWTTAILLSNTDTLVNQLIPKERIFKPIYLHFKGYLAHSIFFIKSTQKSVDVSLLKEIIKTKVLTQQKSLTKHSTI